MLNLEKKYLILLACLLPLSVRAEGYLLPNIDKDSEIQHYIQQIYIYGVGMIGIIATVVIMIGGLIWISSLGNAGRVNTAKDWIGSAILGLALAMFSYMILFIINPDLVEFQPLRIDKVPADPSGSSQTRSEIGWCVKQTADGLECARSVNDGCLSWTKDMPPACRGKVEQTTPSGDTCEKYGTSDVIKFIGTTPRAPMEACNSYDSAFNAAAARYDIDSRLLKAIASQESACNPNRRSPKDACGIMQIKPGTASSVSGRNIDCAYLMEYPAESIDIAAAYLASNRQAKLEDWIAGYNGGYGKNPTAEGKLPPLAASNDCPGVRAYECCKQPGDLAQTQDYVDKVKSYHAGQR